MTRHVLRGTRLPDLNPTLKRVGHYRSPLLTINQGHAPALFSIVRGFVVNLVRHNDYQSLTTARRLIANDLEQLYLLVPLCKA